MSNLPVFETNDGQFDNRYSIYIGELYEDDKGFISLIDKLAVDLGAINPTIVKAQMSSGRNGTYLTADKFSKVQDQLDSAFSSNNFQIEERVSETTTVYLIEIDSDLFYAGYSLLFWKEEDHKETDKDYWWGEISFTKVEEISGIDAKVAALEELVVHFQQQLEDSPKWIRLEKAKKALFEAKNNKRRKLDNDN